MWAALVFLVLSCFVCVALVCLFLGARGSACTSIVSVEIGTYTVVSIYTMFLKIECETAVVNVWSSLCSVVW
jgi:hypothetical protein